MAGQLQLHRRAGYCRTHVGAHHLRVVVASLLQRSIVWVLLLVHAILGLLVPIVLGLLVDVLGLLVPIVLGTIHGSDDGALSAAGRAGCSVALRAERAGSW